MIDRIDLDAISRKIELITTQKLNEKFNERLESEIRSAVKAELNKIFISMRELIK